MIMDEEVHHMVHQLATSTMLPMFLKAAIELGLFDIIAKAGDGAFLSPSDIASRLPNNSNPNAPAMLDRILRLLTCYSILTHSLRDLPYGKVERLYGLGPVGNFFINNENGLSMAPLCLLAEDNVIRECGSYLKDAILKGEVPFEKAHGMTMFEYHGIDPRFKNLFHTALSNHSTQVMKKILETYKGFEGLNSVVDVGGGTGATINMILSSHPLISKGINFDLPHVIAGAPSYSGVEHVGGDMFVSVPKGDAIFIKLVLHDWDDEYCLKLLKNCYHAIPEDGKVIVTECILPMELDSSYVSKFVAHVDVLMLTNHLGGKERTHKEFEALAKAAGFQGFRVVSCAFFLYVMEFLKKPYPESLN